MLLAYGPSPARAQSGSADEAALFLLLPVGAQAVAMGRTMIAMPSPESAFWNPAGLAGIEQGQLVVYRGDEAVGEITALSALAPAAGLGVFGLSYELLDGGEIDETDRQGNVTGRISERNHVVTGSLGTPLLPWLDIGANLKLILIRLSCTGQCPNGSVSATGWAVDVGAQARPLGGVPLRVGAMVAHVGPDLQVVNADQADPLPSRLRLSVAYDVLDRFARDEPISLWLAAEYEDRLREPGEGRIYHLAAELVAGDTDQIVLRAGYQEGDVGQADGFAVGVGIRFERFDVHLAKNLAGTLTGETEPVQVSFGVRF
ncbi:MAG: hypothetical protein D6701_00310 [Gemmatimonadetes bacterium]|nr:MAG: hypothetical protein D6701_00310 [Gemmatimonadota bacterium]